MAEGQSHWEKQEFKCPESDTKLHLMLRLQSWSLGNLEYPFITITLRSTLTQSDSAH